MKKQFLSVTLLAARFVLSPLYIPFLGYRAIKSHISYLKERRRRRFAEIPRARHRRRSPSNVQDRNISQIQSRLFQLPAELRNKIYANLLADLDIHIVFFAHNNALIQYLGTGELRSAVCEDVEGRHNYHDSSYRMGNCERDTRTCSGVEPLYRGIGVLGFVRSCRQA
jgi:hypothetical protein